MKSWKKIALLIIITAALVGGYLGYKRYTAGPEEISSAKALDVSAPKLLQDYTNAETEANKKYIGKIVAVTGEVKEVSKNQEGQTVITLKTEDPMNSINCTMEEQITMPQPGTTITLKGLCTGYMMDVYITRCYLAK